MEDSMIEIPLEGGSGKAKTGPARFRNDWPGLWIRGDELGEFQALLDHTIMTLETNGLDGLIPALTKMRETMSTREE